MYLDSPIWLRQQQQSLKNAELVPKCGVVTPCLNNIHQTVAAVASVTADIERDMWNIMEASSGAELGEVNYIFSDDKDSASPTPPPRHKRKSNCKKDDCESSFSYDNYTYTPSLDDNDFEEVFLPTRHQEGGVDHNALKQSLIACAMRDKLRSDMPDNHLSTPNSQSDYEIPKKDDSSSNTLNHKTKTQRHTHTPPLTPKQLQLLKCQDNQMPSQLSNSNGCLSNNSIFIIDGGANSMSTGHKPKFRKYAQATIALNSKPLTRSCSCTSESTASASPKRDLKLSINSTCTNSSNSSNTQLNTFKQNLSPASTYQLPKSHTNNSNSNNNINYYTFHYPSSHYQRPHHHREKFSPLKAMSNLILPPIVKHSSLFQLFHPTNQSEETQTTTNFTSIQQTTDSLKSNNSPDTKSDVNESSTSLNTENNNDSTLAESGTIIPISSDR